MRERIARALEPNIWALSDLGVSQDDYNRAAKDMSLAQADAVLAAMREPTSEMYFAGEVKLPGETTHDAKEVWRAMIDAASCDSGSDRNGEKP